MGWPLKDELLTIIQTPVLRNLLLGCLVFAVILPVYGGIFVIPSFNRELVRSSADDLRQTADHIVWMIYRESLQFADPQPDQRRMLGDWRESFQLYHLKLFSAQGRVVYSDKAGDLTHLADEPEILAALLDGHSPERNLVAADGDVKKNLVELYVPLYREGQFAGVLGVTQDITLLVSNQRLLLARASALLVTITLGLLLVIAGALIKAGRSMINTSLATGNLEHSRDELARQVKERTKEIRVTQQSSIEALAQLAEYFDVDTGQHLDRIQRYVRLLTLSLGNKSGYLQNRPGYCDEIVLAAVLHDVGKTAIAREILIKPGPLTDDEFNEMKMHTIIGGEVLGKANDIFVKTFAKDSYLALASDIALYHHERWDGNGYPRGLSGEEIPLSARIVAVADVYDALRSRRPYKEAWTHMAAINEIFELRGHQFDPDIIDAFVQCIDEYEIISNETSAG